MQEKCGIDENINSMGSLLLMAFAEVAGVYRHAGGEVGTLLLPESCSR